MLKATEREVWALALHVERQHGACGPCHIVGRIGRLALDGETEGLKLWQAGARGYGRLTKEICDLPSN